MPIYTYECETCGERFEAKQSFADAPLTVCPTCAGKIHRVIQPAGIVFKGSGFYVTDSRGKQSLATPGSKKEEGKSSDGETTGGTEKAAPETSSATEKVAAESSTKAPATATSTESTKSASGTTSKS